MGKYHSEFWALPVIGGIALVLAAWLQHNVLWFLFYISLGCMAVAAVYRWRNWRSITITRSFSLNKQEVEAGDSVFVVLTLSGGGLLPWPWLDITDGLPPGLTSSVTEPGGRLLWLRPWKNITEYVTYKIDAVRRGIHRWQWVGIVGGDPLGLVEFRGKQAVPSQLVAYPKIIELDAWRFFPRRIDGSVVAKSSISHDPAHLIGVREYRPGDRLGMIHWKTSARTGSIHAKEFAPLSADSSLVVLDCTANAWARGYNPAFEEAVKVAASLVRAAWQQQIPIRFYGNWGKTPEELRVASRSDYSRFMLHMAAIAPLGSKPLSQIIYTDLMVQGVNVVVVTPVWDVPLRRMVYRLAARGNAVTVVRIAHRQSDRKFDYAQVDRSITVLTIIEAKDLRLWLKGEAMS